MILVCAPMLTSGIDSGSPLNLLFAVSARMSLGAGYPAFMCAEKPSRPRWPAPRSLFSNIGGPMKRKFTALIVGAVVMFGWLAIYAQSAHALDLFWWLRGR